MNASFDRAARVADGWVMGGGAPDQFTAAREKLLAAWARHERDGVPRTMALAYFSLGPDAERAAEQYLRDYYAWLGDELSGMIAGAAAKDADTVNGYIAAFEAAGCDELIMFPAASDPTQVDLLADAVGL